MVSGLLHKIRSVTNGNTHTRGFKPAQIVKAIAQHDRVLVRNAITFGQFEQTRALVVPRRFYANDPAAFLRAVKLNTHTGLYQAFTQVPQ